MFFLAEYLSVFAVSCLGTALFLGGGTLVPFSDFPATFLGTTYVSYVFVDLIMVAVFFGKVLGFIFVMFWVRATLPRMRVDRLMNFAWKYMVPLSLVNILAAAVWFECVIRPGPPFELGGTRVPNWVVGWGLTTPIVLFAVWFVLWLNRRLNAAPVRLSPAAVPASGR